jgi:hypothetical protein
MLPKNNAMRLRIKAIIDNVVKAASYSIEKSFFMIHLNSDSTIP